MKFVVAIEYVMRLLGKMLTRLEGWGVWIGEGCLAVRVVDVMGLPVITTACRCGLRGSRNDVGRGGRNLVPHVAAGGVLVPLFLSSVLLRLLLRLLLMGQMHLLLRPQKRRRRVLRRWVARRW